MRRESLAMAAVAVILLATSCSAHAASGRLALVFAVNRHGARNALSKTSLLHEAFGGVTLLPQVIP